MGSLSHLGYQFFPHHQDLLIREIGKEKLLESLQKMLLIRNFEIRAESGYQQGKIGGFFHAYIGQEAIQVACIAAAGDQHWFTTTYRCHALALLLGVTPQEAMAELYGKATGNALGRGGSMHLFSHHLLGGLAIVGGHVPIATGAGFSLKYQKIKDRVSFCFLGEGAVVQGAIHESLNLAALWNLPCIYVIENNQWGMGTAVERAVCVRPIAEHYAQAYGISSYTLDGMDFLNCYAGFKEALNQTLKTSKPVLIEAVTERFRGHSISDPALYRSKEALKGVMDRDPLLKLKAVLIELGMLNEEEYREMDRYQKSVAMDAMKFADESPFPDPISLEEGVFAPTHG